MTSSFLSEESAFAKISGESTLIFLLERGLEYTQQGCYAEGAALLIMAREQVSCDQFHLADTLEAFIQEYVSYQHIQQALQEISTRFAEAYARLQSQAIVFETVLSALMKEIAHTPLHCPPDIDSKERQLSSAPSLSSSPKPSSQNTQEQAFSPVSQSCMKESIALPELSITCFGRFEVRRLGKPVVLCSSRNGQSILRYLVARSGHFSTSDTLQAMFWPEDEREVAQRKLHIAISALRRSLNDGVTCEPGCGYIMYENRVYRLNPAVTIRTDVEEFLHYYQMGQKRNSERIALYEKACLLYTGPFLLEDIYADWSFLQREQLSQTYLAMCRVLTDHYLKVKCYEDAVKWSAAILKEDHCDEAAHKQLIQIYAAQGRRSEALQQYQRCERILREELGVQPLPETVQIFQTLLTSEPTSQE